MGLVGWIKDKKLDSMKEKYVGVAVRLALTSAGVTLAGKADDTMVNEIAGALIVLATAAWSMYEKRTSKQVLVTALEEAKMTENQAKARVANALIATPSVNTSPDVVPTLSLAEIEQSNRPVGS